MTTKSEIEKMLPEKFSDMGGFRASKHMWNRAIQDTASALEKRVASVEDIRKAFDKFYQIPRGDTTIGAMMNVSLRDKIISALRKEFVILHKKVDNEPNK